MMTYLIIQASNQDSILLNITISLEVSARQDAHNSRPTAWFHLKEAGSLSHFIAKQGLPFIFLFNNLNVKSFIICIVPSYHF